MESKVFKRLGISLSWFRLLIAEVAAYATLCLGVASAALGPVDPVQDLLRQRLEARERSVILAANEPLCAIEHLRRFYQRRTYRPAWCRGAEPLPS
jgi:hypothetical protein